MFEALTTGSGCQWLTLAESNLESSISANDEPVEPHHDRSSGTPEWVHDCKNGKDAEKSFGRSYVSRSAWDSGGPGTSALREHNKRAGYTLKDGYTTEGHDGPRA